ncbi:hypothetical protein M5D96_005779, partial [Drosophila gunungcola]
KFVAHPLNGFSLIRRLHEDWTDTELLMSKKVGLSNLEAIKKGLDEAQPTDQDLDDAIMGVLLLHRFYNLQPVDIANGVLGGQNAKMSTLDCQVLANSLVNSNGDRVALDWYKTAIEHYDEERDGQVYREVFNFTLSDLYTNYTETLVAKGNDDYNLKFARLNEEHQSALNQRVTDITGENEKETSDFVIYNYGICGFRDSHVDNLELEDQTLSDVAQGGATVFPYANITIWPQKGSAVVWRNLNHAMQPNEDTFHMSCPVIVGSKWIEQNLSTSSEKDENLVSFHNKDYYSSSVLGLVNLLKLEQEFMENFTIYANVLQDKVDNLNIRLNQDWPKLQNYTREPLGLLQLNAMEEILNKAPVSFDMNETLKAMHRIETTYDLQAKDIAKGLLQSKQFNYKLNVRDCLALAHHNFDVGDFSRSLLWFGEASDINTEPSQDIFSKLLSLELKAFATSIIKRKYIKQMGNGWTETDDSKEIVARIHWIREQSPFIDRINQRIADITGFKLEEFPALQLANFGVGGYFRAHHDYYTERLKEAGDVSQGGQTVFPDIKVAVEPQKGNALFWLNDFDDSSPDPRSLHSVCPVIVGSRWKELYALEEIMAKAPDQNDMEYSLREMQRLEKTYDLEATDLARGRLQDKQYERKNLVCSYNFTTTQFLRLAPLKQELLSMDPYVVIYHNVLYDDETAKLNQLSKNNTALNVNFIKNRIVRRITDMTGIRLTYRDLIAMGNLMFQQHDYQAAAKWYRMACKSELEDSDALFYSILGNPSEYLHRQYIKSLFIYGLYRRKPKLVCRYKFTTTPFLRLAPLKFEEINLNPYIGMYHNVLYDSEIEGLKMQWPNLANGYAVTRNGSETRDAVARHAREPLTLDKVKITSTEKSEWDSMAKEVTREDNYDNVKKLIDEYLTGDEKIFQEEAAKRKQRGCRGEWPKITSSQLTCRYNKETSPFLKIAPLKLEFLSLQPLVLLYHEVLYEQEFKQMRDIAIFNATMQDGWTYGTTAPFTLSINRRIADMSGLEMLENMALYLTNYGLGGHFGKHVDYVELADRPRYPNGYMNASKYLRNLV